MILIFLFYLPSLHLPSLTPRCIPHIELQTVAQVIQILSNSSTTSDSDSVFFIFWALLTLSPSSLHYFIVIVCTCHMQGMVCKQHNMIICEKKMRFYVYIFVDLVKCGVLNLVNEIWHYRLLEMTIINLIIIKTCTHPHF